MLILISTGTIRDSKHNRFYPHIIESLKAIQSAGHGIFLVSNHTKPNWLNDELKFIKFQLCRTRQDGKIVQALIAANDKVNLQHSEVVVFGVADEDLYMAVNSRTLLIRCEWASLGEKIQKYGVPWTEPKTTPELVDFLENKKPWYFTSTGDFLDVYSLTEAGTRFESNLEVKRLIERLQNCLKNGHPELKNGFILHFLSSIYATSVFETADIWGVYPSASSKNDGSEIMGEFCALARAMYKKQYKEPVFIRHKPSVKRHIVGGDRNDPSSQLQTIHLNPFYHGKFKNKTIVVLDDYLNRGVSFGVSAALLKNAGAKKVIGLAMGKFGNCALRYDIKLSDNPFTPVKQYTEVSRLPMMGTATADAKLAFLKKFKVKV